MWLDTNTNRMWVSLSRSDYFPKLRVKDHVLI
jgi:hypothetical protein